MNGSFRADNPVSGMTASGPIADELTRTAAAGPCAVRGDRQVSELRSSLPVSGKQGRPSLCKAPIEVS